MPNKETIARIEYEWRRLNEQHSILAYNVESLTEMYRRQAAHLNRLNELIQQLVKEAGL